MAYSAEISRDHPTCILFIIDQSGSMSDAMTSSGRSKVHLVFNITFKGPDLFVVDSDEAPLHGDILKKR
jgi:hypothetical protein